MDKWLIGEQLNYLTDVVNVQIGETAKSNGYIVKIV